MAKEYVQEVSMYQKEEVIDEIILEKTYLLLETDNEVERKNIFEFLQNMCLDKKIQLEKRLYLYRQLIIYRFQGRIIYTVDSMLYEKLLAELSQLVGISRYSYLNEEQRNRNRVIIITEQFLMPQHAPTKNVLRIIKGIENAREEVNEVYIINSRAILPETTCKVYKGIILNEINYTPELLEEVLRIAEIKRCGVGYEQKDDLLFRDRIKYMINLIYELAPTKVIGIGGSNYLTDLVQTFIETYTQGQTVEHPITTSSYIIKQYLGESVQFESINNRQKNINIPYSLKYVKDPETGLEANREMFGIRQDKFLLVVVGNRLGIELREDFYEMCKHILEKYSFVDIVFIGNISREEVEVYVDKNQISRYHLWGYRSNLIATLKLCNLFINPKRQGGGYGRTAAIQAGIPVISIDYGDVAEFLPDQFKVQEYDEMEKYIGELLEDTKYYEQLKCEIKMIQQKYQTNVWEMLATSIFEGE